MRAPENRGEGPPHILVVDDEPQIRQLLRTILEREGYRVTVEADGESGLARIETEEISILVTDLKMPRMSGLELLASARALRPDIGSIMITGYASTETAIDALRHGADDFVTKPFALDDLRRVVDRVLTSRRMMCHERDALGRARDEADTLRRRSSRAEAALATARHDLTLSRRDLECRVRDLEFIGELTSLLAKGVDLQRILETTARILTVRFQALLARIEIAVADGIHTAQHVSEGVPARRLAVCASDLVERARTSDVPVVRDVLLGFDRPVEALAASLDLTSGPAGGITLLRHAPSDDDPRDLSLFGLVPRALAVAVEAELQRRAACRGALDVATRMLDALEGRGALHRGHGERTAALSRRLARTLGLSPRLQEVVEVAARLHDVGEVGVPDGLLQRNGPLEDHEREVLHRQPLVGARILAPLGEAAAFVRHHKERPDGLGYPDGLRGDQIPIGSGIIGVAEAFDAMTHHRAWRPSRSRTEALGEIERLSGTQFVPAAAEALLELGGSVEEV